MTKDLFICYAREDSEIVESFLNEFDKASSNYSVDLKTKIDTSVINLGEEYQKKIVNLIKNSSGAVLFLSKSFLNSAFIKEVEIPEIKKQKILNPNFFITTIFIDDVENVDNQIMSYQSVNNNETALKNLNMELRKLVVSNAVEKIYTKFEEGSRGSSFSGYEDPRKYIQKLTVLKRKNNRKERSIKILIFTIIFLFFGLAAVMYQNNSSTEIGSPNTEERGQDAYISYLRPQLSEESVGKISILSDLDLVNHATWVCSSLSTGIEGYFVYDSLWFLIAQDLLKYNVDGSEISTSQISAAQYYIFNFSNDHFCETQTQIYDIENKYGLHSAIVKNYLRPDDNKFNFKSDFYNNLFPNMYDEKQTELLDTLDPSPSLIGYFYETNEFYNFLIENSCSKLMLLNDEEVIDYVQDVFDNVQNLSEQNYQLDVFTTIFEIVPQLFCSELRERGVRYSTYLYLIERKF